MVKILNTFKNKNEKNKNYYYFTEFNWFYFKWEFAVSSNVV